MRLGKRSVRHDPRTLQLAKYIQPTLPPNPPSVDWTYGMKHFPMYANDRLGDCTCAAAAHLIHVWTKASHMLSHAKATDVPLQDEVIAAYERVSGYRPEDPDTDQGAIMLNVLRFWRKTGIAQHRIGAFASVEVQSREHVLDGLWLFGGLYAGIALPLSAKGQAVWEVPANGARGQGERGSWGGHAVPIVAADPRGLTVVTWGALKRMSWAFWKSYGDECYAVLSDDFLANDKAPNGFDITELRNDLRLL
jgi:hypothetical protein